MKLFLVYGFCAMVALWSGGAQAVHCEGGSRITCYEGVDESGRSPEALYRAAQDGLAGARTQEEIDLANRAIKDAFDPSMSDPHAVECSKENWTFENFQSCMKEKGTKLSGPGSTGAIYLVIIAGIVAVLALIGVLGRGSPIVNRIIFGGASSYEGDVRSPPTPSKKTISKGRAQEILIIAASALAIFLGIPMIMEGASGPCSALEHRLANSASSTPGGNAFFNALAGFSDGRFGSTIASQQYPRTPPAIGCAAVYWNTVLDPSTLRPDRTAPGS